MASLSTLIRPELIFSDLAGADRSSVLREAAERVVERGFAQDADELYGKLMEREELGSTGIGGGVAVPHCKCSGLSEVVVSVGVSRQGVEFGAEDGQPVRILFLVLSPPKAPAEHLQALAAISRWIRVDGHAERLLDFTQAGDIFDLLVGAPRGEDASVG